MNEEGPELNELIRRLSDCPSEFLNEPFIVFKNNKQPENAVNTIAIINDLIYRVSKQPFSVEDLESLKTNALLNKQNKSKADINFFKMIHISAYLFYDDFFQQKKYVSKIKKFLAFQTSSILYKLAQHIDPEQIISEPERREEFSRLCLQALDLRPKGETIIQAKDRLTTIDTIARIKILQESKKLTERTKKLREEMEKQAAIEAASKYNRE